MRLIAQSVKIDIKFTAGVRPLSAAAPGIFQTKEVLFFMPYDFTTMLSREGQDAIAVEKIPIPDAGIAEGFSRIPMWVADMNFATVPTITEAIIAPGTAPGFTGISPLREEYYDAIIRWQTDAQRRYRAWTKDCIGYENGVLGGVVTALRRAVLCRRLCTAALPHLHRFYRQCWKTMATDIVAQPARYRMRTASGAWTMRTWTAS